MADMGIELDCGHRIGFYFEDKIVGRVLTHQHGEEILFTGIEHEGILKMYPEPTTVSGNVNCCAREKCKKKVVVLMIDFHQRTSRFTCFLHLHVYQEECKSHFEELTLLYAVLRRHDTDRVLLVKWAPFIPHLDTHMELAYENTNIGHTFYLDTVHCILKL